MKKNLNEIDEKKKKSNKKKDDILEYSKKKFGNYVFKLPDKNEKYSSLDFIHTGSYYLNYIITGDMMCGAPKGKMIEFFGSESVGKTSIALSISKHAAKNGARVLYGDFERGLNQYYASQMNIDPEYFYYFKPDFGEQGFDMAEELINKFNFDLFICDSVGGARTRSQMEGNYSKENMGVHSRLFGKVSTRFSKLADKKQFAFILINQLSSVIGQYGKTEDTKGGKSLKFFEWCRIQCKTLRANKIVSKVKTLDDVVESKEETVEDEEENKKEKEEVGILVNCKTVKNKLYIPQKTCQLKLLYGFGFDEVWDLANFLAIKGIVDSNKERTKLKYKKKAYNTVDFFELFEKNNSLKEEIVNQIK